jgi:D-alanyl-lipoteichoic acid acyltransferase DltB (MBOAT superfamily)
VTITPILVFSAIALVIGWAFPKKWRIWAILGTSLAAIYWLQPGMPLRNLDFWLPSISILLTILVWSITQTPSEDRRARLFSLVVPLLVIIIAILGISLARYVDPICCLTPTRPPDAWRVIIFLLVGAGIATLPGLLTQRKQWLSGLSIILIIGLFIILKSPALATSTSSLVRQVTGQSAELASGQDIIWFGFSFLAFRLLHVLFDFRSGKLPAYPLEEFIIYALFFPALPAGPIDRVQHFITNLRQPESNRISNLSRGGWRILWGIFKKFVVADSLALIALNGQNASQVSSPLWMWVLLYFYSLRIYFDFSGYTDIAIGIGNLIGFSLPENFDRPYIKTNLTAFWNSWHITLAQWFRAYFFNPLTRFLRRRSFNLPAWLIILLAQFSTMLLIGLWHGITWNYAAWGAWHGLGLFIHNRWADYSRARWTVDDDRKLLHRSLRLGSWFITFNYVTLGWVWFILPNLALSRQVFSKLFGL